MPSDQTYLDRISIAEPCSASWDAMDGDERKRFCGDCKLHVYNLSDMTARAARRMLSKAEGRVCGRFFRRADGTVVTQDCGPVRRALRRRMQRLRVAVSAVLGFLAVLAFPGCGRSPVDDASKPAEVPAATTPTPTLEELIPLMGDVCAPEELGRVVRPAPKKPSR